MPAISMPVGNVGNTSNIATIGTFGNSRIPLPARMLSPLPRASSAPGNSAGGPEARMRYRRADVGAGSRALQALRCNSPSQPFVQSWYAPDAQARAATRQSAQTLVALEQLLARINRYNRPDSDLGRFGSVLRIANPGITPALTSDELLRLPCDLRDARRDAANVIARLRDGAEVHPIECNFNAMKALLDRLDDLQPSLPTLAYGSPGSNDGEAGKAGGANKPAAQMDALRLSVLSPASIDSLASCDLPSGMSSDSGGSSPTQENLLLPPLRSTGKHAGGHAGAIPKPHAFAGISRVLNHHRNRMAAIAQSRTGAAGRHIPYPARPPKP